MLEEIPEAEEVQETKQMVTLQKDDEFNGGKKSGLSTVRLGKAN